MKRVRYDEYLNEHSARSLKQSKWVKLVCKFAHDAPKELARQYDEIAHEKIASPVVLKQCPYNLSIPNRLRPTVLSENNMYIYWIGNNLLYGKEAKPWPMDETKWPFTAWEKGVPFYLPKGVVFSILKNTNIKTVCCMRKVNKWWRKAIDQNNFLWNLFVSRIDTSFDLSRFPKFSFVNHHRAIDWTLFDFPLTTSHQCRNAFFKLSAQMQVLCSLFWENRNEFLIVDIKHLKRDENGIIEGDRELHEIDRQQNQKKKYCQDVKIRLEINYVSNGKGDYPFDYWLIDRKKENFSLNFKEYDEIRVNKGNLKPWADALRRSFRNMRSLNFIEEFKQIDRLSNDAKFSSHWNP